MKPDLFKKYNEGNDIFGYPQVYKDLILYPIKIRDTKMQDLFYLIFSNPKNYIPNKDILKSSYLKFVIYVIQASYNSEGNELLQGVKDILSYITKKDVSIEYRSAQGEGLASITLFLRIGDNLYSENDFDDMREIILEQNGMTIDFVEEFNPDLEENLNFLNRANAGISFQDEIFTFCAIMKLSLKEVEEYTMYQFKYAMEKLLALKEYDMYKPLIVSGQVELKSGEIKPYLYRSVKAGRYDSIKMDVDDFKNNSDIMKASQNQ